MKMIGMENESLFKQVALTLIGLATAISHVQAASYEWTFNNGDLSTSLGNGTLAYADAQSGTLTSFGTTGSGVPNIGGQAANFMHVPAFTATANGYNLTLADTGPNGGGSYVNQYTMLFDVLSPNSLNWTPFFNTEPANANDADFYLASYGTIGIGSIYSGAVISADTWYRIAFVADLSSSTMSYYVNGNLVASGSQGGSGLDGRWSLYSNQDAGHDVRLFNEPTGLYTHELYVNSIAFVDHAMTADELSALGGPSAVGILAVPEPATFNLLGLGLLAFILVRKPIWSGNA